MSVSSAPPLPNAPRPKQPKDVPSHATFLLEQTRSSLSHLHQSGALDVITYRDVEYKLSKAVLKEPEPQYRGQATADVGLFGEKEGDTEEVRLGKKNAWLRKAFSETSLLPSMVEAALNIVGAPFLGDNQVEAIVKLVEMSQKKIGDAVTNPKNQQQASSSTFVGLKGAGQGIDRGVAAANSSIAGIQERRQENKAKAQAQKEKKEEDKAMRDELKTEREQARHRASEVRGSTEKQQSNSDIDNEQVEDSTESQRFAGPVSNVADTLAQSDQATASVAIAQLSPTSSAAITTFHPGAGVVISSTVIAASAGSVPKVTSPEPAPRSCVTSPRSLSATSLGSAMNAASFPSIERQPSSLAPMSSQSISEQDEAQLRQRQPPPLPSSSTDQVPQTPQYNRGSTEPPAQSMAPPPQHRSRPPIGERSLDESDRVDLPSTASLPPEEGNASSTAPPGQERTGSSASTSDPQGPQPQTRVSGADEEIQDVTDKKRKGWKSKLLG